MVNFEMKQLSFYSLLFIWIEPDNHGSFVYNNLKKMKGRGDEDEFDPYKANINRVTRMPPLQKGHGHGNPN